jgi:hypothetical protein
MSRHWVKIAHREQRPVLTDMLPFEVPPTFSNRGFYQFLRRNDVVIRNGTLQWTSNSTDLDIVMALLFGFPQNTIPDSETRIEWGRLFTTRSVRMKPSFLYTIPFTFRVAHKQDGRSLTIPHPRNQMEVASFYVRYGALIAYYCQISDFSIRRPVAVSRFVFFEDKLHSVRLDDISVGIEDASREYERLGSYFVYRSYKNIHRFFESYRYHRAEKKYSAMVQVDISRCFDRIYTHSLCWATMGKAQTKLHLDEVHETFGGKFDKLMQSLNHQETNGIVIGPEFSRIFAEIILQAIDSEVSTKLRKSGLVHRAHYQIFRYVDDYFIFYNEPSARLKIIETLQETLKDFKLSINELKIKDYNKPIITEITIAKERVSALLNDSIDPKLEGMPATAAPAAAPRLTCSIASNRLIVRYKTIIKETRIEYGDIANYTFSILEKKAERILRCYKESDRSQHSLGDLLASLLALIECAFFIYSASPKVNHTVRICRMISSIISFLRANSFTYEHRHLIFKYVHDNIVQQIDKNIVTRYREVENLYLLITLSQIGREYRLPIEALVRYFGIEEKGGTLFRTEFLNHFSITVMLSYIKNIKRYQTIRMFIEEHIIDKLRYNEVHCLKDGESILLFLDVVSCPFVTATTKAAIGNIFKLDAAALASVEKASDRWFTVWGDKLDLGRELEAKRSLDVY